MTIEDKTLVLGILQLPRLGLNQQQIGDIERVIDGRPAAMQVIAVTNAKAAEMLGLTSKNSTKTIEKYVREGKLVRSTPGHVTVASMRNLMERPEGRRSDMGVGANREGRRSDMGVGANREGRRSDRRVA